LLSFAINVVVDYRNTRLWSRCSSSSKTNGYKNKCHDSRSVPDPSLC